MTGQSAPSGAESEGESASSDGRKVAFWKSSMIPNFVSPRPGQDPMGMDLIPVYADELGQERLITLAPEVVRNMGLRTAPVRKGSADRVIRTVGKVEYAEPLVGDVTLKVGGWIEELFVDFVGRRVEKGQPLFTFYSPELVSAQEEYLISLRPRPTSLRRRREEGRPAGPREAAVLGRPRFRDRGVEEARPGREGRHLRLPVLGLGDREARPPGDVDGAGDAVLPDRGPLDHLGVCDDLRIPVALGPGRPASPPVAPVPAGRGLPGQSDLRLSLRRSQDPPDPGAAGVSTTPR